MGNIVVDVNGNLNFKLFLQFLAALKKHIIDQHCKEKIADTSTGQYEVLNEIDIADQNEVSKDIETRIRFSISQFGTADHNEVSNEIGTADQNNVTAVLSKLKKKQSATCPFCGKVCFLLGYTV